MNEWICVLNDDETLESECPKIKIKKSMRKTYFDEWGEFFDEPDEPDHELFVVAKRGRYFVASKNPDTSQYDNLNTIQVHETHVLEK